MHRLLIHVEGQTEESFVNEILAEHLHGCGYTLVSARLVAGYEKPLHGILAALNMKLEVIRNECPHFNDWLTRLETWPSANVDQ